MLNFNALKSHNRNISALNASPMEAEQHIAHTGAPYQENGVHDVTNFNAMPAQSRGAAEVYGAYSPTAASPAKQSNGFFSRWRQPIQQTMQQFGQGAKHAFSSLGQTMKDHPYVTGMAVGGMAIASAACPYAGAAVGVGALAAMSQRNPVQH